MASTLGGDLAREPAVPQETAAALQIHIQLDLISARVSVQISTEQAQNTRDGSRYGVLSLLGPEFTESDRTPIGCNLLKHGPHVPRDGDSHHETSACCLEVAGSPTLLTPVVLLDVLEFQHDLEHRLPLQPLNRPAGTRCRGRHRHSAFAGVVGRSLDAHGPRLSPARQMASPAAVR